MNRTQFGIWAILVILTPIIRRADRPDSRYLAVGARYPAVGAIGRMGDGTLIAPQWVLTAAHVARGATRRYGDSLTVQIGGRRYRVTDLYTHAAWTDMGPHDVALLCLGDSVRDVRPIPLYRGSGEAAKTATLLGHGGHGTGSSRDRAEDGRLRGATSRVDSADADWLYFSFDEPPSGTELEGAPGPGDSGGPALLIVNGRPMIAGVSSGGYDGRDGPASYGAIDQFTRVSTHAAWIDSVMRAHP